MFFLDTSHNLCLVFRYAVIGTVYDALIQCGNRLMIVHNTWKSGSFDDVYFEEADTFDSLLQLALEQAYKLIWKPGHYGNEIECEYLKWS